MPRPAGLLREGKGGKDAEGGGGAANRGISDCTCTCSSRSRGRDGTMTGLKKKSAKGKIGKMVQNQSSPSPPRDLTRGKTAFI